MPQHGLPPLSAEMENGTGSSSSGEPPRKRAKTTRPPIDWEKIKVLSHIANGLANPPKRSPVTSDDGTVKTDSLDGVSSEEERTSRKSSFSDSKDRKGGFRSFTLTPAAHALAINTNELIHQDAQFISYEHFEDYFERWKRNYLHPFRVASSEALREPDGNINETFKYRYAVFHCAHYGEPRMRGIGKRPNQNYLPCGCRAMLRVNYSFTDKCLKVTTLNPMHNDHEVTLEMYTRVAQKCRRSAPGEGRKPSKKAKAAAIAKAEAAKAEAARVAAKAAAAAAEAAKAELPAPIAKPNLIQMQAHAIQQQIIQQQMLNMQQMMSPATPVQEAAQPMAFNPFFANPMTAFTNNFFQQQSQMFNYLTQQRESFANALQAPQAVGTASSPEASSTKEYGMEPMTAIVVKPPANLLAPVARKLTIVEEEVLDVETVKKEPEEPPMLVEEKPVEEQEMPVMKQEKPVAEEKLTVKQEMPMVAEEPPKMVQDMPMVAQETAMVAEQTPMVAQEPPMLAQEQPMMAQEQPMMLLPAPMMVQQTPMMMPQIPILLPKTSNVRQTRKEQKEDLKKILKDAEKLIKIDNAGPNTGMMYQLKALVEHWKAQ